MGQDETAIASEWEDVMDTQQLLVSEESLEGKSQLEFVHITKNAVSD